MAAAGAQGLGHGMGLGMAASAPTSLGMPPLHPVVPTGGAVDGLLQLLRQEAERRGGIIDWECRYDGFGDAKEWTAVPHLGGQELARPRRRGTRWSTAWSPGGCGQRRRCG